MIVIVGVGSILLTFGYAAKYFECSRLKWILNKQKKIITLGKEIHEINERQINSLRKVIKLQDDVIAIDKILLERKDN